MGKMGSWEELKHTSRSSRPLNMDESRSTQATAAKSAAVRRLPQ